MTSRTDAFKETCCMTENTKNLQRVVNEGLYNTFLNPERDLK